MYIYFCRTDKLIYYFFLRFSFFWFVLIQKYRELEFMHDMLHAKWALIYVYTENAAQQYIQNNCTIWRMLLVQFFFLQLVQWFPFFFIITYHSLPLTVSHILCTHLTYYNERLSCRSNTDMVSSQTWYKCFKWFVTNFPMWRFVRVSPV